MDAAVLWTGFAGTLIGSLTSIATLAIQNAAQRRKESQQLIVDSAFKDYELRFRYQAPGTPGFFPFPVMLAYYQKTLQLIESSNLTPETAGEIVDAMGKMRDALAQAGHDFDHSPGSKG